MITNSDITIYNAYYNKERGITEYNRTVIRGVNWQGSKKSTVSDKGIKNADYANIFIPMSADFDGKTYIGPRQYNQLSPEVVRNYFTFQTNDKIVNGMITFDVTGEKGKMLKDLEHNFDDVLTIMSVVKWDKNVSTFLAHYHIGAQ